MNDFLLRLYHRLPASTRSVAASLRGLHLYSWRYGHETERMVEEALERESWSPDQWKTWQETRLAYTLRRAATWVPYYREQWAVQRHQSDRISWKHLENWPILEKEPLRENSTAFIASDCSIRHMFHEHTSGTTGKSLDLWWSQETVRTWYALYEARCRRWYGVSRHDRWAILGGQLVTPVGQRRPPFWVWNVALHQLYMSSYHLAPDLIPHYLDALKNYHIKYLWGYTSSLYALAQEALQLGRDDLKMAVVITNAEPVFDYQRQAIAEAFQCPVRETYGMAEIVAAASECESGRLHLWPEVGWVEILENNQPVSNGTSGDLVCTGLLNVDMPLIRYHIGDRGALPGVNTPCACGRTLPILASVEGRVDDMLYTPDGRRIGRLDPIFKTHLPVREAQVIQETLNRVHVRYVPAPDFTPEAGRSIIDRLQARMGMIEVILEQVDEVPREVNGKFRPVICNLPRRSGSI
jgi:phenylacetate-coenzyme A ligase PaaK-like adenylate-forming protein